MTDATTPAATLEAVGVWRRAAAVIIDSLLLFVVGYAIAAVTGGTTSEGFNLRGAPFFLWLAVTLGYYIVMEATRGATLGKMAMKLKVVKEGGAPLDWQASIVRNVLRLIDGFFFYLVGAIVVWTSKRNQRLGDMAAHTLVVKAASWAALVVLLAVTAGVPVDAHAGLPRYEDILLSDKPDGEPRKVFKSETQKIILKTRLADVPKGAKVRGEWIAVKTAVAPANYKIDTYEMKVGSRTDIATFSMTRPTAGWPEGEYRIDLFIDNQPKEKVFFRITK